MANTVGENNQYIYTNYFKEQTKDHKLYEKLVYPKTVVFSKYAISPSKICNNEEGAVMFSNSGESVIVLDFGEEVVGYLELTIDALEQSNVVIYYGEEYEETLLKKDLEKPSTWFVRPKDEFISLKGERTLNSKGRRAFRYMQIVIPKDSGRVSIKNVSLRLVHHEVNYEGAFSCSDNLINRIWDISVNTTKLCMQQFYEDGIKRDGLLWLGDARIQFLSNYYAFGDKYLARKSLYMMAASQRSDGAIPACSIKGGGHQHPYNIEYMPGLDNLKVDQWILLNYCIDFIGSVYEYYMYTEDKEALQNIWSFNKRLVEYLYERIDLDDLQLKIHDDIQLDNGILTNGNKPWFASYGVFLFQLYEAISLYDKTADFVFDESLKIKHKEYLKKIEKLINDEYYNLEEEIYVDDSLNEKTEYRTSYHVHAYGALSGLIEDNKAKRMFKKLEDLEYSVNIQEPIAGFTKCWVLAGILKSGYTERALKDIKEYFGYMLKHGATTCWERVNLRAPIKLKKAGPSKCHGWSAGSSFLLPKYVLGVQPKEPGFKQVEIKPELGDLKWAEGTIPTPYGNIFVHFENVNELKGTVVVPEGIKGKLIIKNGEYVDERILKNGINVF